MEIQVLLFLSLCLFSLVYSSPVQKENDPYSRKVLQERLKKLQRSLNEGENQGENQGEKVDSEGEYTRYLKELMANNPELAEQFEKMAPEMIAKRHDNRFAHKNRNVRSEIDELQRINLERMRRVKNGVPETNRDPYKDPRFHYEGQAQQDPKHIESRINDFNNIQKELDSIRKQQFHSFEKRVEDARKKKMKEMDEAHRLKEEERLGNLAKQHREHDKMRHPASRKQLEDVWANQDGLKDAQFDGKTFFHLHDKNGDGVLDFYEIEALFMNEIKKVYGDDVDSMAVEEELTEMREHVFSEVDINKDGFVSLKEFMIYTNDGQKFDNDEEWKPLEERDDVVMSQEDMDLAYDYGDEDYNYQDMQQQHGEDDGGQQHPPSEGVPLAGEHPMKGMDGQDHGGPPPTAGHPTEVIEHHNNQQQQKEGVDAHPGQEEMIQVHQATEAVQENENVGKQEEQKIPLELTEAPKVKEDDTKVNDGNQQTQQGNL